MHLASWETLFADRRVMIAPLPPPKANPAPVSGGLVVRAFVALVLMFAALGAGYALWRASGRWWIGLMVFCIVAWVAAIFAWGVFGAIREARAHQKKRFERAMEHPITRLLPHRGLRRAEILEPARYEALFELSPRPVMLFDEEMTRVASADEMVGSLAPKGHLPEPEPLAASSVRPGGALGALYLLFQGLRFTVEGVMSVINGAGLTWQGALGFFMVATAGVIVFTDPWFRRKIGLPKLLSPDAEIGAGWIRTVGGDLFTVADSIVLMTLEGRSVEVRCIRKDKVDSFFLPILYYSTRKNFQSSKYSSRLSRAMDRTAKGVRVAVGAQSEQPKPEMPTDAEPLRLLLSGWTYPEPRVDLAPRAGE